MKDAGLGLALEADPALRDLLGEKGEEGAQDAAADEGAPAFERRDASAPDGRAPLSHRPKGVGAARAKPHHAGHRERLRERFRKGGADALADYELLELVLFRAIPRRDVKPLAKEILARFGGFAAALSAEPARLKEVPGVSDAVATEFAVVRAAAVRLAREEARARPALSNWAALIDYLRARLAHEGRESFHVLFLDRKNKVTADEEMGRGTVDQAAVYPREVVKRALELGASALILVHNHPSGDPSPSRQDVDMTLAIIEAAKPFDILVHDHVIVGKEAHASFRSLGLI